jgi:hypothetical protein
MSALIPNASATESRIAARLVDDALRAGYSVSVYDGEAWPLKRSTDRAAILDALASTDLDTLKFRDSAGEFKAWVTLIWGNGCDLLSDWSDTPATEVVIAGALQVQS